MKSNHNTFVKVAFIAILSILVFLGLWLKGDLNKKCNSMDFITSRRSEKNAIGQTDRHPVSADDRKTRVRTLLDQLSAEISKPSAQRDNRFVINSVTELHELGQLNDLKVVEIFATALQSFSVDELAELTNIWPFEQNQMSFSIFGRIGEFLSRTEDSNRLIYFFNKLDESQLGRADIYRKLAQKTNVFSPDNLKTQLSLYPKSDLGFISDSIAMSLDRRTEQIPGKKVEWIDAYMAISSDEKFISPIVGAYVGIMVKRSPEEAITWVKAQDPVYTKDADWPFITNLAVSHPLEITEYINSIKDEKRFQECLVTMSNALTSKDPITALKWGIENSSSMKLDLQVIGNPFGKICRTNPTLARELIQNEKDPERKKLFISLAAKYIEK
jgi:hypothetical protein